MSGAMKQVVLASYAKGNPKPSDFRVEEVPIPVAGEREILLKTLWLAVDPLFRFAIDEVRLSGALHLELGDVMAGATVCEVVASNHPDYKPGDVVIIEPEWEPRPGDCVAAKNGKQEATFKKYRLRGSNPDGNDIFELVPINDNYPTVRSDETPLTIIGVMAELRRKTRRR